MLQDWEVAHACCPMPGLSGRVKRAGIDRDLTGNPTEKRDRSLDGDLVDNFGRNMAENRTETPVEQGLLARV